MAERVTLALLMALTLFPALLVTLAERVGIAIAVASALLPPERVTEGMALLLADF